MSGEVNEAPESLSVLFLSLPFSFRKSVGLRVVNPSLDKLGYTADDFPGTLVSEGRLSHLYSTHVLI